MGTKVNSNYESLLTFTRASKGHALRPVSYGTELVTNGDFSETDLSDWSSAINSTATVTSGELVVTGVSASGRQVAAISTTVGQIYKLSGEGRVSTGSGTALLAVSDTTGGLAERGFVSTSETTATDLQLVFVATQSTHYVTAGNGSSGTGDKIFDNISVKEVTFDQPDGTLTLFEHPENVPRVEYDADGNRLGLLVEEARTNLITYSTPDSNWTPSRVTITENNAVSPDGTENATRINETTATNSHYISGNETSVTSGLNYTLSVYVKADTSTACQLLFSSTGFGSSQYANFDLSTGTVGYEAANATATIQDVGNGWYRCAITSTATATTFSIVGFVVFVNNNASSSTRIPPYAGNTAHQMYVYGAQVEEASFPTSYIKNEGTSGGVTRSADVASIPVADFGYNYTNTVGTFLVDWNTFSTGAGRVFAATSSSSASGNRAVDMNFNISSSRFDVYSNHTAGDLYGLGTPLTVGNKVAAAMEENDSAAVLNGGTVDTDTATGTPITATHFHLGNYGTEWLNGHIKSIKYYPRRLTNAQLVDLTS